MIKAEDLDDIYDGNNDAADGNNITTFKPAGGGNKTAPKSLESFKQTTPTRLGGIAHASNVDVQQFDGYIPGGTYDYQDIDILRGQGQSAWDKWGNVLGRTLGKTVTGVVEGIGYLPEIFTNSDGDYSNALTEAMQSADAWMDKTMPIYRTSRGTWGAPTDLGWWLGHAEGLVSSVASFAIGGAGIAKGFGALGKLARIGKMSRAGLAAITDLRTGIAITNKLEQTLTAGMLAYTEGAMSGKAVFDKVYQVQLNKALANGVDFDTADANAKKVAAQSASTAVQLNTTINTGLNMLGGVSMFFNHGKNQVVQTAKKNLFAKTGESTKDWVSRLATENSNKYAKMLGEKRGWITTAREAVGEGLEEMTNQFAERTGIEEGSKGRTHSFMQQFAQLEHYFDRTMDEEGALNFVLGAVGGPAQGIVSSNVPIHKVVTGNAANEQGELINDKGEVVESESDAAKTYLKNRRVTAREKNKFVREQYFDDVKKQIEEDANHLFETEQNIQKAIADGNPVEAERLKVEYFNAMNLNSVSLGFAENMKETYHNIANLDNTKDGANEINDMIAQKTEELQAAKQENADTTQLEAELQQLEQSKVKEAGTSAMHLGFTDSVENNDYKEKAQKAIKDLDALQKIHDKVFRRYGPPDSNFSDVTQKHVANFIFERAGTLHLLKNYKEDLEQQLVENDDPAMDFVVADFDHELTAAREQSRKVDKVVNKRISLSTDADVLRKAIENPTKENMAAAQKVVHKMGTLTMLGNGVESDNQALTETISTLQKQFDQTTKSLDEIDQKQFESKRYKSWLKSNPDGNFESYLDYLADNKRKHDIRTDIESAIDMTEAQIESHEYYLNDLKKAKSLDRLMKNTKNYYEKLAKEYEAKTQEQSKNLELKLLSEQRRRNIIIKRNELLQRQYQKELEQLLQTLDTKQVQLFEAVQAIENYMRKPITEQSMFELDALVREEEKLKQEIETILERIDHLKTLYTEASTTISQHAVTPVKEDVESIENDPVETGPTAQESGESVEEKIPEEVEEIPEQIPEEVSLPASEEFHRMLDSLSTRGKLHIGKVIGDIQTGTPWALSMLKDVEGTLVPEGNGPAIMQSIKDYLEEIGEVVAEAEEVSEAVEDTKESTPTDTTPVAEEEENTAEEVIIPQTNPTVDLSEGIIKLPANTGKFWDGKKQVNPADKAAIMTVKYLQRDTPEARLLQSTFQYNENTNPDVVNPKKLRAGTKVIIAVDTGYNGPINDDNYDFKDGEKSLISTEFKDYTDSTGKVLMSDEAIGNVPIKIMDENGRTLAWLHRADWITATNSDTPGDYRNVVDVITDSEGKVLRENNAEAQKRAALALRRKIIESFNSGNDTGIPTTITEKGGGTLQFTNDYGRSSARIKGDDFYIGIIQGTTVKHVPDIEVKEVAEGMNNRPVVLVPLPNGEYAPVSLKSDLLYEGNDNPQSVETFNTFKRIIELHLMSNTAASTKEVQAEVELIKNATGFDISTLDGFRNIVTQQFTHLSKYSKFVENGKDGIVIDTFKKGAQDPTNQIIIAETSATGSTKVTAKISNGELDPKFVSALKNLLGRRYKAIALNNPEQGIQGIGNPQSYSEVTFKEGEWKPVKYDNYNHSVLSNTQTKVTYVHNAATEDGSIEVDTSRGKSKIFNYGANPLIEIDVAPINDHKAVNREVTNISINIDSTESKSEVESFMEEFGQAMGVDMSTDSKKDTVGTNDSPPITLEQLKEMRNFTSNADWNGKSVHEVWDELERANITHLADGVNPFIC